MKPMVEGNPKVTISVFHFEDEKEPLGTVQTTYAELDAIGNHDAPEFVLEGTTDFRIPSSVAFVIWAEINGGDSEGCVTTMAGQRWHAYEWQAAA